MSAATWTVYAPDGRVVVKRAATREDAIGQAFDPRFGMSRDVLRGLTGEHRETAGWAGITFGGWRIVRGDLGPIAHTADAVERDRMVDEAVRAVRSRPGGGPVALECEHGYDHCPMCDRPKADLRPRRNDGSLTPEPPYK